MGCDYPETEAEAEAEAEAVAEAEASLSKREFLDFRCLFLWLLSELTNAND